MTTIPTFTGNFSIEFDTDDNKYYAMQGAHMMNKRNGQVAAYKSLSGAVKFFAGLGIEPVVAKTEIAKITEIRGRFVDTVHYTVAVFSRENGFTFLGRNKEIVTRDQALALIPGARVTNSDTEFARRMAEVAND